MRIYRRLHKLSLNVVSQAYVTKGGLNVVSENCPTALFQKLFTSPCQIGCLPVFPGTISVFFASLSETSTCFLHFICLLTTFPHIATSAHGGGGFQLQ